MPGPLPWLAALKGGTPVDRWGLVPKPIKIFPETSRPRRMMANIA